MGGKSVRSLTVSQWAKWASLEISVFGISVSRHIKKPQVLCRAGLWYHVFAGWGPMLWRKVMASA